MCSWQKLLLNLLLSQSGSMALLPPLHLLLPALPPLPPLLSKIQSNI